MAKKEPARNRRSTDKAAIADAALPVAQARPTSQLVIITGLSGSGKLSVLRSLEDLGYYAVDNLPLELIPTFAELVRDSSTIRKAALVVDVREGVGISRLPETIRRIKAELNLKVIFLEADDEVLIRRFSETRRPHPLADGDKTVRLSIASERQQLEPIRQLADLEINTSKFNVHDLRDFIKDKFRTEGDEAKILLYVTSFGFRHGLPQDADLVFDVRFLPNPNYIPKFKKLTGLHPGVAKYILSFPQTGEFINRISELLKYLLPHYIREGKSYLTVSFGCTGGHHRSVMIADQIRKNLVAEGYQAKVTHRDIEKAV